MSKHSTVIGIRVNNDVNALVRARAKSAGMSVSDWVKALVEKELAASVNIVGETTVNTTPPRKHGLLGLFR